MTPKAVRSNSVGYSRSGSPVRRDQYNKRGFVLFRTAERTPTRVLHSLDQMAEEFSLPGLRLFPRHLRDGARLVHSQHGPLSAY